MFSSRDVRSVALVGDDEGDALLKQLSSADTDLLGRAGLTRTGPAESRPWFGSLRMTRVPVCLAAGSRVAVGHLDVQRVGAGTTEVRLSLRRSPGWRLPTTRRALDRVAEDVLRRITGRHDAGAMPTTTPEHAHPFLGSRSPDRLTRTSAAPESS